jgi:hypothetical protein
MVDALARQELRGRVGLAASEVGKRWVSGAGALGALVALRPAVADDDEIHG